jgi:hypothetical protein
MSQALIFKSFFIALVEEFDAFAEEKPSCLRNDGLSEPAIRFAEERNRAWGDGFSRTNLPTCTVVRSASSLRFASVK